jgi:hypothetical protein
MAKPREILKLYKASKGDRDYVQGPLGSSSGKHSGYYVTYKIHSIKNVWGKGKVRYLSEHFFKTEQAAKNFLKLNRSGKRRVTHKVTR